MQQELLNNTEMCYDIIGLITQGYLTIDTVSVKDKHWACMSELNTHVSKIREGLGANDDVPIFDFVSPKFILYEIKTGRIEFDIDDWPKYDSDGDVNEEYEFND